MCNKESFTKKQAEAILKVNRKSGKQYRKEMRTYYCGSCNSWHLTSKELWDDQEDISNEYKQLFQKYLI